MLMIEQIYPKAPSIANPAILKPSARFKRSVRQVIVSILLFVLLYIVLLLFAVALLAGCIYAGITLISFKANIYTFMIGLGLMALGVMFFAFLVKFIFSRSKDENPYRVEVTEAQQPLLFEFIRKLSVETKTRFPKKIFLSPDVNAGVFYHSSFWSMFLPVRKNLEIGLGLVNSLNVSEFKAVIGHEFGHFSQSSMKVGSYIYTVNRAIYNMVYEYDRWDALLSEWADSGGIMGFFAKATFWIVEQVRSLLKIAYNLINKNYMKLSREMEFNADLMAASVAGKQPMANALRKVEFNSYAYHYMVNVLESLAKEEKSSSNVYQNHRFIISFLADRNDLRLTDGQLVISEDDLEKNIIKSRVNVEDQWASHPSLKEREENLEKIDSNVEVNPQSAWTIFQQADQLKQDITRRLYQIAYQDKELHIAEEKTFEEYVLTETEKYTISSKYHGFYDNRYLQEFDLTNLIHSYERSVPLSFDELYSKEHTEKIKRFLKNREDLEVLHQINLGNIKTRYFEFDNQKYRRKEVKRLIQQLETEIASQESWVREMDKKSFRLHYFHAKNAGQERKYLSLYRNVISLQQENKRIGELSAKLQKHTYILYATSHWTEEGSKNFLNELSFFEIEFKRFLQSAEENYQIADSENLQYREVLKEYITNNRFFISASEFDHDSFTDFSNLLHDVFHAVEVAYVLSFKELTDFQLEVSTATKSAERR